MLLQGREPAVQQLGVTSQVRGDLFSNSLPIHMNRQVALLRHLEQCLGILIAEPPNLPRFADRAARRSNRNTLFFQQKRGSLPHCLHCINQPKYRTVALRKGQIIARYQLD